MSLPMLSLNLKCSVLAFQIELSFEACVPLIVLFRRGRGVRTHTLSCISIRQGQRLVKGSVKKCNGSALGNSTIQANERVAHNFTLTK